MRWIDAWGSQEDFSRTCPLCGGSTWIKPQEMGIIARTGGVRCPCWHVYNAALRLWQRGFPKAYLRCFFDPSHGVDINTYSEDVQSAFFQNYPESQAWSFDDDDHSALTFFLENYCGQVRQHGLSLFIHGPKGAGKTALATALAVEAAKRYHREGGWDGSWLPSFVAVEAIYEGLSRKDKGVSIVDSCFDADLLVLDDLRMNATGYIAADTYERIHRILQHRSQQCLPTIITANKVGAEGDFAPNSISAFLGISKEVPKKYGRFRFIGLKNDPLRPDSLWDQ